MAKGLKDSMEYLLSRKKTWETVANIWKLDGKLLSKYILRQRDTPFTPLKKETPLTRDLTSCKDHNEGDDVYLEESDDSVVELTSAVELPKTAVNSPTDEDEEENEAEHGFEVDVPYTCDYCNTNFAKTKNFVDHMRSHVKDPDNIDNELNMLNGGKYCQICTKLFETKCDLDDHMKIHVLTKRFTCDLCPSGKSFQTWRNYNSHRRTVHKGNTSTKNPYTCPLCPGQEFVSQQGLNRHISAHNSNNEPDKLVCPSCPMEKFDSKDSLLEHMQIHKTSDKCHQCVHCGRYFSVKSKLVVHLRSHTGARPYTCLHCGKNFSQTSTLNRHLRSHSEQHLWQCKLCGKEFVSRSRLLAHVRGHTTSGRRRPWCNNCKAFAGESHQCGV